MLEIVIIGTRYFPFSIIIPCPIPPHKWEWVFFQSFSVLLVFFSPLYRELYSWEGEVKKPLFNQTGSAVAGRG